MKILFVSSGSNLSTQPKPLIVNQARILSGDNFEVSHFLIKNGFMGYLKAIIRLHKRIKGPSYEIIHAHYGLSGLVSSMALFGKVPIIISFMGDDLIGSVKKNRKYSLIGKWVIRLNIFFAKHVYDYVIVKSETMYKKLSSLNNMSIIPNGVDLSYFPLLNKAEARKRLKWDQTERYVIFVSEPERPEKNYQLAVKAAEISGDFTLFPVFNLSFDQLYQYYAAADCLLLTSFHEGSPNVVKEGMACNIPIVSTDVGDVRWVLGNTEGCYLASYDPNDVAEKLGYAIDFAQKTDRTKGRERIMKLGLDAESVSKRIMKIYQLVGEKNR